MSRVLLLTGRRDDAHAIKVLLSEQGHVVELADSVPQLVHLVGAHRPDIIIADVEPWTWAGRAVLDWWTQRLRAPRLVLLCVRHPDEMPPQGLRYVRKPLDFDELRAAIGEPSDDTARASA